MARFTGRLGVVKIGATPIGGMVNWSLNIEADVADASSMDDEWDQNLEGSKRWSGDFTVRADRSETSLDGLVIGALVALSFHPEGDAVGTKFRSGSARITSIGESVARSETVDMAFSFTGDGELAEATS